MTDSPALRPLRADDAAEVLSGFLADPQMERQGDVQDASSAKSYIEFITNPEQGNIAFAIEISSRCAGVVAINGANQHKLGWLFYWMHPDFRGRGITGSAAATVASWALSAGGFERLELGHRANNPASGGVALAAGFIQEGVDRKKFIVGGERVDALTYGRLSTDPTPATQALPLHLPGQDANGSATVE